jgi:hypothetical protein
LTAQLPDRDRLDTTIFELLDLPLEGDCQEALSYYLLGLERSWVAMERLIGPLGALAVVQYSLRSTSRSYPQISSITANERGLNLATLEPPPSPEARLQMCMGLKELFSIILRTLSELTGDVLVGPLIAEVRDYRPKGGHARPNRRAEHSDTES